MALRTRDRSNGILSGRNNGGRNRGIGLLGGTTLNGVNGLNGAGTGVLSRGSGVIGVPGLPSRANRYNQIANARLLPGATPIIGGNGGTQALGLNNPAMANLVSNDANLVPNGFPIVPNGLFLTPYGLMPAINQGQMKYPMIGGNQEEDDEDHDESKDSKKKCVCVRGKPYHIRKAFLEESSKFEADLVKLVGKKKKEELSDRVVRLLVGFINNDSCKPKNLVDLVQLNILAANLGSKSAMSYSLEQIKKKKTGVASADEWTKICYLISMSSKVDDELNAWLKRKLTENNKTLKHGLESHRCFLEMLDKKPEVRVALERLLGHLKDDINDLPFI